MHFDFKKECIFKTSSLDNFFARIFSQYGKDGLLHSVAFFFYKYLPKKINYKIYDQELLAIIKSFKE